MKMHITFRLLVAPTPAGDDGDCAHLELDPGGSAATGTNHEPWARSGPGLF